MLDLPVNGGARELCMKVLKQYQINNLRMAAFGLFLALKTVPAFAAPITFNTALPVSEEEVILREQLVYTDLSGPNTDVNSLTAATVVGYGITPKWSVFGVLPVTHIDANLNGVSSDSFGLGDATLFSRYEIYRKDGRGTTTRLAPLIGLRLPTGKTGETSDGSTDIFGGLIATIATTQYNLGGQVVYTENGEANDFEEGNSLTFDASLQYRVWNSASDADSPSFLFGVIEGNITRQGNSRVDGIETPNASGTRFSISPGLQYVKQRWIADVALTIPITDSFNNVTILPNYSILTSLRINF